MNGSCIRMCGGFDLSVLWYFTVEKVLTSSWFVCCTSSFSALMVEEGDWKVLLNRCSSRLDFVQSVHMLMVVAFIGADRARNSVIIAEVAWRMPSIVFLDLAAYSDGEQRASPRIIESSFTSTDQLKPVCS